MPKGVFERTKKHKQQSRLNGQTRTGKLPVNAKYVAGYKQGDFEIIERLSFFRR